MVKRQTTTRKKRTRKYYRGQQRNTDHIFNILLLLTLLGLAYIIYQFVSQLRNGRKTSPVGDGSDGDGDSNGNVTDQGGTSTLAWVVDLVITIVVLVVVALLFRWWFFDKQSAIRHTMWNRRLKTTGMEGYEKDLIGSIEKNWKELSLANKFKIILEYDLSALKLNLRWLFQKASNLLDGGDRVNVTTEIHEEMLKTYIRIDKILNPPEPKEGGGMDVDTFAHKEPSWIEYIKSLFSK